MERGTVSVGIYADAFWGRAVAMATLALSLRTVRSPTAGSVGVGHKLYIKSLYLAMSS